MHAEAATAIVALCVTGAVQLGGLLIWGAGLTHRVKAIERDIEPLKALSHQVTRMEARLEGLLEQMKDLNAAFRWMREPGKHETGA